MRNLQGPSVISQHILPTYRQANVTRETSSSHPTTGAHSTTDAHSTANPLESSLPDILHSHMVHQAAQPRHGQQRQQRNRNRARRPGEATPVPQQNQHRVRGSRHQRRSRASSTSTTQTQDGACKEPCVKCVATVTSFRWVLVVLSVLGVCCVVTGIVLAAVRAAGNSFLFLAIMFIGLGVLLVIVVGVGWKCTPRGHEPLHALFGIGNFRHGQARGRRPRRHRNRDGNWFGGFLYPEFQYRRPPPSYAASMQDYQNQTPDQDSLPPATLVNENGGSLPSSPPPSYRSRASTVHSGIHIAFPSSQEGDQPSSRPPTYRSRAPSRRPSIPLGDVSADYTSDDILELSLDDQTTGSNMESGPASSTSCPAASVGTISAPVQGYTIPVVKSSHTDQHSSPTDRNSTAVHYVAHQSSRSTSRLPSLHQRMASEDRHILEQTLQSLEEHMNETEGITNPGADFDEPEQVPKDYNTHL
ncbi:unnamed protein product [Lymnaea stagnalis]|uniref:Uncharacterized protein n=1 Tax=Lymnaea stagnalis TaxID=6523 RepID=A0AAV2I9Y1_LYMST